MKLKVGDKINYLTILKIFKKDKYKYAKCLCFCGKIKDIYISNLFDRGNRKAQVSCGCINLGRRIHNSSKTYLHTCWWNMLERCNNINNKRYYDYGGRGIKVCKEWEDFTVFKFQMKKKLIDAKRKYKNEKVSIERINNDDGYYYENCTFIPMREQHLNRRGLKVKNNGKRI